MSETQKFVEMRDAQREEILARYTTPPAQDKGPVCTCARKEAAAAVAKAGRDYNTGADEPKVPASAKPPVPDPNPQAVPSSSRASTIRDGAEATRAHQADVAAAGATGAVATPSGVFTHREATAGLSPHLRSLDAGRLAVQRNGGGNLKGGTP
jgi:hypothetical protein